MANPEYVSQMYAPFREATLFDMFKSAYRSTIFFEPELCSIVTITREEKHKYSLILSNGSLYELTFESDNNCLIVRK